MAERQVESRYGLRYGEHAALADVALPSRRQVESLQRWRYDVCCALLVLGSVLAAWCILERAAEAMEGLRLEEQFRERLDRVLPLAEKYVEAFRDGDFEFMLTQTPEKVIEEQGGKEEMRQRLSSFRRHLDHVFDRKPEEVYASKPIRRDDLVLVAEVRTRVGLSGWRIEMNPIAISFDQGQSWKFLPHRGYLPESLRRLIPDLPD